MIEDRYLIAGWAFTIGIGVACLLAWFIAIVTVIRLAEGIEEWFNAWWPL